MLEEYYGLRVKILLTSKAIALGTVTEIDKNGAFISLSQVTLISESANGKSSSTFPTYTIEGNLVEDLDIIPMETETETEKKPKKESSQPPQPIRKKEQSLSNNNKSSSWISVPTDSIKAKEFDFEENLKRFDKEKFTAEQKQKNSKDAPPPSQEEEQQINQSSTLKSNKQSLKETLPNEAPSMLQAMQEFSLEIIDSLSWGIRIENAAISCTFWAMESKSIKKIDCVIVRISASEDQNLVAICIATARHLLGKGVCKCAFVHLLDELFCYGGEVVAQLKHFHEAGGVIESVSGEFQLASGQLCFTVSIGALGLAEIPRNMAECVWGFVGEDSMICDAQGATIVLVGGGKRELVERWKKNGGAKKVVFVNDGRQKGSFYGAY